MRAILQTLTLALCLAAPPAWADTIAFQGFELGDRWGYTLPGSGVVVSGDPKGQTDFYSLRVSGSGKTVTFVYSVPAGTGTIALRLTSANNGTTEYWYIDDVTISGTPSGAGHDDDSEIAESLFPLFGTTLQADNASDVFVFNADLLDWGTSDALPTTITALTIRPGPTNTADWSDTIASTVLYDWPVTPISDPGVITDGGLTFTNLSFQAADGDGFEFAMTVTLKSGGTIVDGSVLSFSLDGGADATASSAGSTMAATQTPVVSADWPIEVTATDLVAVDLPGKIVPTSPFVCARGKKARPGLPMRGASLPLSWRPCHLARAERSAKAATWLRLSLRRSEASHRRAIRPVRAFLLPPQQFAHRL